MDKYAVEIDPKKVEKEKEKTAGKTSSLIDHPDTNIHLDPEKGSLPYEKTKDD